MIRVALAALAFLAIFAATAHAQSPRVIDGTCDQTASSILRELQADVDSANSISRHCIPPASPLRPGAEARELSQIETGYHDWVRSICSVKLCLSNQWAAFQNEFRGVSSLYVAEKVFAGCFDWADQGSNQVVAARPQYWAIHQVKIDNMGLELPALTPKPDNYHWVVELDNVRTHEKIYLDGWRAAAAARAWGGLSRAMPDRIDPAREVYTEEFENDRGNISYRGPSLSPESICNPPA